MSDSAISSRLSPRARWPIFIGMCLVAATIIYPLFFVVATSLRSNVDYKRDPFGIPAEWTIDNYLKLWNEYGVGRAFMNSLFVSTISITLILLLLGQRLAKDYDGARTIAIYFVPSVLAVWWLS